MFRGKHSKLIMSLFLLLVICFNTLPVQAKYGGGTGEPEDPYQIWDANHMQAIGADENDWDKCFRLMADIDLAQFTGDEFNIIGIGEYPSNPFTGVFDGDDHAILNFTYDSNGRSHIGLFGCLGGDSEVKNLGLIHPNIQAGMGSIVGSIAGSSTGTIINCYAEGASVSGDSLVGGLVGESWATITGCSFRGTVSGYMEVGGLVGQKHHTVTDCYVVASISGFESVGGLIGYSCCGRIIKCYTIGDVTGGNQVGGLIGSLGPGPPTGVISNCVEKCYAAGSVEGNTLVGGLAGYSDYCTRDGCICFPDLINESYWNLETSGEPNMCGSGNCDDSYGKTTAEMMQQSTFTDWDFINVWDIGENQTYPYLRVYIAGDMNRDFKVNFLDFALMALHWCEDKNP